MTTPDEPNLTLEAEDQLICFCYNVPRSVIVQAIKDGATTLELIKGRLGASTGCTGCESEVIEILETELKKI